MNLTDTHCHLDFKRFDGERPDILKRAWQAGLSRILVPGITLDSSQQAVRLSASNPNVFAAIGVHPNEARSWDKHTCENLRDLASGNLPGTAAASMRTGGEAINLRGRIVAIGEVGLDYYRQRAPRALQRRVLSEQLDLAAKLGLPVIIHLRDEKDKNNGPAWGDLLTLLTTWISGLDARNDPLVKRPGVLHSYSGNLENAKHAIKMGFLIGVSGPVTFRNAAERQHVIKNLPVEKILIETDAPFLTPEPYRGRRNEPAFVHFTAERIAQLHNLEVTQVAETTTQNASRLFLW